MARMTFLEPVTLGGNVVTLEPLHEDHHDGLVAAASDGERTPGQLSG